MPQPRGYSRIQIVLHWTIAALVIFQLFVNEAMQHAFADQLDGKQVEDENGALLHMVVGLTVLLLAAIRLIVRLLRGAPAPYKDTPAILRWLGHATHVLLYGFIFLMPLTGATAWFLGLEVAAELHEIGRLILVPAIGVHVIGALAEHFVFRNDTLMRMLRATAD
ncbi:cytochrome b [Devosia ginsengisoli]|uniref:Cytochrome b n=1 Tax=Devosia ginsengisoli TaxID=400770 RepID=A0A5B8LSE4_9HYPH|nr:cytochrome b/b6 domain-containing protein [Devosia ginsengisoli]QDZ10675.1 cytochrome b [Devosia ginsengisoli]